MIAANERGRDGPANQSSADEPERRRRHGERHAAGEPVLVFHQLAERGAGAVAAGHRNRPGDQAEQRVHVEHLRQRHPDRVLEGREHRRQAPEQEHLRSAHPQQAQARPQADGGEERNHQRGLERRVELEGDETLQPQHEADGGEQEPAHHRGRDVVAVQDRHLTADPVADEQHDGGERQRLHHVELQRQLRHRRESYQC